MNKTVKIVASCMVLWGALSLAPGSARAFIGGDEATQPASSHVRKMTKELQLTEKQQQQVKNIFADNRTALEPLIKQIAIERRSLRTLVRADTVDEAAIREQSAKVAAIQADLAINRAHLFQKIREILTPEQIAKAKALQAERDKRGGETGNRQGRRFRKNF